MNSVGFVFGILLICFTLNGSYAAGRIGVLGGNIMKPFQFPVGPAATFSASGQVNVSIEKYGLYNSGNCTISMDSAKYDEFFNGRTPICLHFPFTDSPSDEKYSPVTLFGTSIVTPVPESGAIPYHVDVTFTLTKAFLADKLNPATSLQVYFSRRNIIDSQYFLFIGSISINSGTVYKLLDVNNTKLKDVTIDKTTLKYLGPQQPSTQIFTLISLLQNT